MDIINQEYLLFYIEYYEMYKSLFRSDESMLIPRIWGGNLFDDFGDFPFSSLAHYNNANTMMKTDVKEINNNYELTIDMPGIKKECITAELKNGYLTVSVESKL